jgi:hypothetical protein
MINDLVIVEIKTGDLVNPVWKAQVISYLKLTGMPLWILDQLQ